jgi:hypothetical protein
MARPGDTVYRTFRVTVPGTNTGVTGLTLGAFVVAGYAIAYAGAWAAYSVIASLNELGDGWYSLAFVNPSAAGYRLVTIKTTLNYNVNISGWDGEVENNDLDSIYSSIAKPVITLAGSGTIGQQLPISLIVARYRQLVITFKDQNGNLIDLTQYSNLAMSIRSKDQTQKYDLLTDSPNPGTITGTALGVLTITIPDTATFGAWLPTPTASSTDTLTTYWEVVGNLASSVLDTVALIPSSSCVLTRREVGT